MYASWHLTDARNNPLCVNGGFDDIHVLSVLIDQKLRFGDLITPERDKKTMMEPIVFEQRSSVTIEVSLHLKVF